MYVTIQKSLSTPTQEYIGFTKNLRKRFAQHNQGEQEYTKKYRPWIIKVAFWLEDGEKAVKFEKYLKTGAGFSFRKKHF